MTLPPQTHLFLLCDLCTWEILQLPDSLMALGSFLLLCQADRVLLCCFVC